MSNITPEAVKHLREQTGAGMMLCKQALLESNGNFEEAVAWLRKKGCDAAQKRSGRTTSEGIAALVVDHHNAAIIEINCETDFVARNDKFQSLVDNLRKMSLNFDEVADIKKANYPNTDGTVEDALLVAASTSGENINVRRLERFSVHRGIIGSYVHNALMPDGGKIAVLVVLESDLPVPLLQPLAKQIAMHIGAANPAFLSIEDVDEESLRMEREIFHAQAASAGKSEEVMAKMVEGKVQKYYQDVVLLEQAFIMDNKIKIKDLIKNFETKHGEKVILQDFARYEVGEGI